MKKYRSVFRTLFLLALVACTGIRETAAATPPAYHVTDLGTLGGGFTAGTSINASGQVAGYSFTPEFVSVHAILWTPTSPNGVSGTLNDLGPGAAYDINDSAQVTGHSDPGEGPVHAFLYDGTMHDLGTLGGTLSEGFGINDSGQVTGLSFTTEGAAHTFLYDGTMNDLGSTLGGTNSYGRGINNGGQVTGDSQTTGDAAYHAFLWTPTTPNGAIGTMNDLGTLGGAQSGGVAINDIGQVVGYSNLPRDTAYHAFLYDGTMHDLGTLGGADSYGSGINTSGQVVGNSLLTGGVRHAFLYTSGNGMVDLNSLIDPLSGWELSVAYAINDAGQITGFGEVAGETRAFLLTPVPEPASLALFVLGLPFLVWRGPRRRSGTQPFHRRLRIEPLEERRLLATFTVGNLNDAGAGSLRQAILDANDQAGADTIEFESVAGTIALTSGEMEITDAVAINGPGDEVLTIDAQQNSRILNITALTGDVALNGLTLTGGRTTGDNVEFYDTTFNGGAIRSLTTGNLTITNSTVSGNSTAGKYAAGGGIYGVGNITLTNSTVSGNHTTGYGAPGGGVYAYGNVTLTNSTVSGNSTTGKYAAGGGMHSYGNVALTDSTVSENHTVGESADGGGVNSFGDVTLNHSAVNGNHTEGTNGSGGGISSQGDVTLNNSSVSGNHTLGLTAVGGGIFTFGNVTLNVSTVSGNHTTGEGASGGAIRANSSVTLVDSTVSGNYTTGYGATGGGIWAYLNVTLTNSTVSGNHTGGDFAWGGGSFSYGNLTLTSSTISGNHTAGEFANGAGAMLGQYAALTMSNSILAGNTADDGRPDLWMVGSVPPNLHFSLVGNNFGALLLTPAPVGSPDANGNLIGTAANPIDPLLGPLADNGGPTLPDGSRILTQAPLSGSPAINSGDPAAMAGVGGVPLYDQRGTPWSRVGGGRIDRGALELQSNPLTGDYNFSGVVDAADYTVYRDTLGSTIDLRADGSGNGSVGPEDYAIWKAHYGETLPPGAGSGTLASTAAEFVAPSVERVASDRVSSDQVFVASDGDGGRLAGAPHFALDAHARPTIHLRRAASSVVDAISAATARQDHALLAWVASATRAVPDDDSSDLYRPSTRSPSESLPDCGLGVLDAAFGLLNGQ